jgi:hypothetical protein
MLRKAWYMTVLIAVASTVPLYGQTKLEWKLKEGDIFYLETVVTSKQSITSGGKTVKQDLNSTTVTGFTVKKKTAEGGYVLEQKIESVKIKTAGGFGQGVEKLAKKMKGALLTLTLDKNMKVAGLEGYEDLVKKIAGDDSDAADAFRLMVPEETYKMAAGLVFGFLPDKAVVKGKSWKKKLKVPLGPLGSLKTENEYTLKETTTEGVRIDFTSKVNYTAPDDKSDKVPFKIVKGDLSADEAKGTLVFDPAKGRLIRSEEKLVLSGNLTVEVAGNKLDLKVEQTTTSKGRLLDKAPEEK